MGVRVPATTEIGIGALTRGATICGLTGGLQRYPPLSLLVKSRWFLPPGHVRTGGFMAGSFTFFRKYQRSMLVAVAVLAMLAFFVLPPFLQMTSGPASSDPVVVSWKGGELREGQLDRAVAMRTLTNRFLLEAAAVGGRDASQLPAFPEGEELIVRELLLAGQAEEIGLTVSNTAINEFLATWTDNKVRQDQFDQIIAGLRYGRAPVAAADLFDSLRTALTARNMLLLFQTGFSGDPPGWSWDFYKRLEQAVTVEAYPVAVEQFAVSVDPPKEAELRAFFERYKNDLPVSRSPDPGFKEPFRIRFAALKADRKKFEDEAAKTITDEDVKVYYEENKETRFRAPAPPPAAKPASAEQPVDKQVADADTTPANGQSPAADAAAAKQPAAKPTTASDAEAKPAEPSKPAADAAPAAEPKAESSSQSGRRLTVQPVAFLADEAADAAESATQSPAVEQSVAKTDAKPAAEPPAEKAEKTAGSEQASEPQKNGRTAEAEQATATEKGVAAEQEADTAGKPSEPAEPEMTLRPLEEVADQIRQQLTRERATATIDAIFSALAGDLTAYAEDRAVWQARGDSGQPEPVAPDIEKIAEKQGLVAEQSDWITAPAAAEAGGIGGSFEFVPDPGSRFGIRQRRWLEMIFAEGSIALRPITSRDAEGNRYFSWKQDEQEERVPSFAEARDTVEKAWRIVEARPLAKQRAAEIAAAAAERSLAETVGKEQAEAVRTVGPFTWLTQGTAGFGAPPMVSEPNGLVFPGEAFMQAVFATPAGASTSAFNEPETFCYALRVIAMEPDEAELRTRFTASQGEPRRVAMVAQEAFADVFRNWIEGLEESAALTWNREPRPVR